jgi:hypothetical protein
MGYRIRVLALKDDPIPVEVLRAQLPAGQELDVESEEASRWSQLVLKHKAGPEIALIERDQVVPGQLGAEELQEYLAEIQGEKPEPAVRWLTEFLPRVKVIYALQILRGADEAKGWSGVHCVQRKIWQLLGGILQADGEGFTNESGHHILWQFDGNPTGAWQMAVLEGQNKWRAFEMRLEDPRQKRAFLEGRVPEGAKPLD